MRISFCFLLLFIISQIKCEVITLATPGQNWDQISTWSPQQIPTADDSVIIGGLVVIPIGLDAHAEFVSILLLGHLLIERDLMTNTLGRLFLDGSPQQAIINYGTLDNGGRIDIQHTPNGIINEGLFRVKTRAKVTISGIGTAITNNAVLKNLGLINIENANNGIINTDSLFNRVMGVIEVNNIIDQGLLGIKNIEMAYFENDGTVTIDNTDLGIFVIGSFHNNDSIIIKNSKFGLRIAPNDDENLKTSFRSNTNSTDLKNNAIDYNMINNGFILVDSILAEGISNSAGFKNEEFGKIEIRNVEGVNTYGIVNVHGSIFENDNYIYIWDGGGYGIYNDGTLINRDSILVFFGEEDGIYNSDSIYNSGYIQVLYSNKNGCNNVGSFHNNGLFFIASLNNGIHNSGMFINENLLLITLVYSTIYNDGVFHNYAGAGICTSGILGDCQFENNIDATFINEGELAWYNEVNAK